MNVYSIKNIWVFGLVIVMMLLSACAHFQFEERVYRIPVKVYLLQSESALVAANAGESDIKYAIEVVNTIWSQANIEFYVQAIQPLNATNVKAYIELISVSESTDQDKINAALKATCRIPNYSESALNVCVTGLLYNRAAGAYFNDAEPLVMWPTSRHNQKRINPSALAHEFGHFLDLTHNGLSKTHLMFARRSGFRYRIVPEKNKLTDDEVRHARSAARRFLSVNI